MPIDEGLLIAIAALRAPLLIRIESFSARDPGCVSFSI
jgi:hypothetical protein